ncbi:MAG TPA: hypothetical protein VFL60_01645 [Gaiellaceae bacterium]|nr:hypothetical protein [Gaiellaceae bacterium]
MNALSKTLAFATAVAAASAAFAAAASLALGSQSLSAGNAAVTSCGISSLGATRRVDNSGSVAQVTVRGIPAACAGETLSLTLVDGSGAALASASQAVAGTTATFSSLPAVQATSLAGYRFAVTGA